MRYTDPNNYYYVSLRTSNELSLRKVVNGVITELARAPFTLQSNQPYRLRFEAIGTKLIVYVNDQVRLQASDSSHPRGRYGVVTYRAAASFGDLQPGSHKAVPCQVSRKPVSPGDASATTTS